MQGDSVKVLAVLEGQKWELGKARQGREEGGGKEVKRWMKEKEGVESWSIERGNDFRSRCGS